MYCSGALRTLTALSNVSTIRLQSFFSFASCSSAATEHENPLLLPQGPGSCRFTFQLCDLYFYMYREGGHSNSGTFAREGTRDCAVCSVSCHVTDSLWFKRKAVSQSALPRSICMAVKCDRFQSHCEVIWGSLQHFCCYLFVFMFPLGVECLALLNVPPCWYPTVTTFLKNYLPI